MISPSPAVVQVPRPAYPTIPAASITPACHIFTSFPVICCVPPPFSVLAVLVLLSKTV